MTKSDALKNIRESLKSLLKFSNEITENKFATLQLTDGTNLTTQASDLEVGAEIYALDDLGNQTPLDDGDYVLTDGRTFTVSGNVIESIVDGDGVDPENPVESGSEDITQNKMDSNLPEGHEAAVADATGNPHPDQSGLEGRITDLEKQIEDIKAILDKMSSIQNDVNQQMMSKMEQFASEPGAPSIKSIKKEAYSYDKANAKKEVLGDLLDTFKQVKEKPVNLNFAGTSFTSLK